jgi:hypothetical protein
MTDNANIATGYDVGYGQTDRVRDTTTNECCVSNHRFQRAGYFVYPENATPIIVNTADTINIYGAQSIVVPNNTFPTEWRIEGFFIDDMEQKDSTYTFSFHTIGNDFQICTGNARFNSVLSSIEVSVLKSTPIVGNVGVYVRASLNDIPSPPGPKFAVIRISIKLTGDP